MDFGFEEFKEKVKKLWLIVSLLRDILRVWTNGSLDSILNWKSSKSTSLASFAQEFSVLLKEIEAEVAVTVILSVALTALRNCVVACARRSVLRSLLWWISVFRSSTSWIKSFSFVKIVKLIFLYVSSRSISLFFLLSAEEMINLHVLSHLM